MVIVQLLMPEEQIGMSMDTFCNGTRRETTDFAHMKCRPPNKTEKRPFLKQDHATSWLREPGPMLELLAPPGSLLLFEAASVTCSVCIYLPDNKEVQLQTCVLLLIPEADTQPVVFSKTPDVLDAVVGTSIISVRCLEFPWLLGDYFGPVW